MWGGGRLRREGQVRKDLSGLGASIGDAEDDRREGESFRRLNLSLFYMAIGVSTVSTV